MQRMYMTKEYQHKARKAFARSKEVETLEPAFYSRKGRAALKELRDNLHEYHMANSVPTANS